MRGCSRVGAPGLCESLRLAADTDTLVPVVLMLGGRCGVLPEGRFLGFCGEGGCSSFLVPATGSDRPLNLPRLATPIPHVNWVL